MRIVSSKQIIHPREIILDAHEIYNLDSEEIEVNIKQDPKFMSSEEKDWISKGFGPMREFMDVSMSFQAPSTYKKK